MEKKTWKRGVPEKTKRNQEMYKRWKGGERIKDLAIEYNIKKSTVHNVVHREDRRIELAEKEG